MQSVSKSLPCAAEWSHHSHHLSYRRRWNERVLSNSRWSTRTKTLSPLLPPASPVPLLKPREKKKVFVSNPQKQPQSADMFCCIGSPFEKWSLRITHWSFTANWLWPRRSPLLLCGNLCNNVLNSTYRHSSSSNSNDSSIESCIGSASNNNSYCSSTFVSE